MVEPATGVVPFNDLSRGISRDFDVLIAATREVLESGWLVHGGRHREFERVFAEFVGVPHVVGVASGTDALELAMRAGMPEGRRTVLSAANAGGYSSTAALSAGFEVVYADVDPESLCLSESTVLNALDESVGVVVVTHLYGRLTDIRSMVALCHSRGIRVIEDCAESIGARVDGKHCGSFADLGTFSFYPTKNLGAIGDGGAVATSNDEFAEQVRKLRQYGWGEKYRVEIPGGRNSRLDELQAAFLLCRLPALDGLNARRRQIIERYRAASAGGPLFVLGASDESHAAHLAVCLAAPGQRDHIRARLSVSGVQTDVHFPVPDHRQPGFLVENPPALPVTEGACSRVLSLPCFPELTAREVDRVCSAIGALS